MSTRLTEQRAPTLPQEPGWGQSLCRFGRAFLAWEDGRVTDLGFGESRFPVNSGIRDDPAAAQWLEHIIEDGIVPPVTLTGSSFQLEVWKTLQTIPRGDTRSYAEIAKAVGCTSARAAGQAVAANRIGLLIPCHRVIRSNGLLGGFRWGLPVKTRLLEWETVPAEKFG